MPQRAYKFRFYPTNRQKKLLSQYFGAKRYIWNNCLQWCSDIYKEEGDSVSPIDFSRELTWLKKTEGYQWLAETPSTVYGQALNDLKTAFDNFFKKKDTSYPKFKSRKQEQSVRFQLYQNQVVNLYRPMEFLSVTKKFGKMNIKWTRRPMGIPKMATISMDKAGRYYVSLSIDEKIEKLPESKNMVGVDLGVNHALVLSNGEKIDNPRYLNQYKDQLIKLQQRLSRQKLGSGRWYKTKLRIARLHRRIADCRYDYIHKFTTKLVRENQTIAVEDINVKGITAGAQGTIENPGKMVKQKSGLNRAILDVSFGEIVRQLEYKAKWYGRELLKVDRFFASSQICHKCGSKEGKKTLDIRAWTCASCGSHHDRDINAAINILLEALGLTPVGSLKAA